MQLASALTFGPAVAPLSLPELNQATIPGSISWGALGKIFGSANQMQVPVISAEECRAAYGSRVITDRMMCAGNPEGGKDAVR